MLFVIILNSFDYNLLCCGTEKAVILTTENVKNKINTIECGVDMNFKIMMVDLVLKQTVLVLPCKANKSNNNNNNKNVSSILTSFNR